MILYRDGHLVAINKPAGLLVHRTGLAAEVEDCALRLARDRLGQWVHPVHRLDRPVSGVLLFALCPEMARRMSRCFAERVIAKGYLGVVRGWPPADGVIDYALSDGPGQPARPALTRFRTRARVELPVAVGRYPSSRYALVEIWPESGRYHQIRRHFHHLHHPLIGDTTHGEGRHNRFFRDCLGVGRLLLHARSLRFTHPVTAAPVAIEAPLDSVWTGLLTRLGWGEAASGPP